MASTIKHMPYLLPLALTIGALTTGYALPARAITLTSDGHAAGAQCGAAGVNDSNYRVGNCTPGNASDPTQPWVDLGTGTQTKLPLLASGQSSIAGGINNNNLIIGSCKNASDVWFACTWDGNNPSNPPVVLNPIGGLLGLGADVTTSASGFNQHGDVVGQSCSGSGNCTAVIWPAGTSTAMLVSSRNDNSGAVDVNDTLVNGLPSVAVNTPKASGTASGGVAQATGLLSAYVLTSLPCPSGSTYCTVAAINNAGQAAGTSHFPAPDEPNATFWSSFGGTPKRLNLTNFPRHGAIFLNNVASVIVSYQNANGQFEPAFWKPLNSTISFIPCLTGGKTCAVAALADNADKVLVNSENGSQTVEAEVWTPTGGAVPVGFEGGGVNSGFSDISPNGSYGAGGAENSAENSDAVDAVLP